MKSTKKIIISVFLAVACLAVGIVGGALLSKEIIASQDNLYSSDLFRTKSGITPSAEVQEEPLPQEAAPEVTDITMVAAEETVRSADQELLDLQRPVADYKFISKRGLIRLDGNDYYCVSAYLPNVNGSFDYAGAYLLDSASGTITHHYDEATGEISALH